MSKFATLSQPSSRERYQAIHKHLGEVLILLAKVRKATEQSEDSYLQDINETVKSSYRDLSDIWSELDTGDLQ